MAAKGWKGQSARHSLAARGVRTKMYSELGWAKRVRSGRAKRSFDYEGDLMSRAELEELLLGDHEANLKMWLAGEFEDIVYDCAEEEEAERELGWYGSVGYFKRKHAMTDRYKAEFLGRYGTLEPQKVGESIGISWGGVSYREFLKGLAVEREHGSKLGSDTNVTGDDVETTARIALAHLKEMPDYYTRLEKMEGDA